MIYKDISNIITTHEINDIKGEIIYIDYIYAEKNGWGTIAPSVFSKYIHLDKIKVEDHYLTINSSLYKRFIIPIDGVSKEDSKKYVEDLQKYIKNNGTISEYGEDIKWDENFKDLNVDEVWIPQNDEVNVPFVEENFLDEEYGNNPQLIKQLKRVIIDDVIENLENLANQKIQKNYKFWDKVKNFVYKFFGKTYIKKTNIGFNNRKIINKILMESNLIAVDGRTGPSNKCIVSGFIGDILQKDERFNLETNIIIDDKLPYLIGSISNISVYVDPIKKYKDFSVLVYRSNEINQPGTKVIYQKDSTKFVLYDNISLETNYKVINAGFNPERQVNKIVFKNISNG